MSARTTKDSLWQMVRDIFRTTPQQRIEALQRERAKMMGDQEYHRTLANYYTERAASLDPNVNWWEFADAKQKEFDNCVEAVELRAEIASIEAQIEATK